MKKTSRAIRPVQKTLTTAELEMMNIIWRIGPCSVAQVVEQLKPQRELAYTSVSTIIRILEQKGFVASKKEGRGHLYAALVPREEYQARSLKHLMSNLFDDAPTLLVERLLDDERLSADELTKIKALLRKASV